MPEVLWLGTALKDLQEIKDYYETREEGLGQKLAQEILSIEQVLTHHPLAGRIAKDLYPEHRQMIRGHYLIIYRVEGATVKIVAVIDSRRDFLAVWQSKNR